MKKSIRCMLGMHSWKFIAKWHPSISARIITEVKFSDRCTRCGKEKVISHLKWDGEEMVEIAGGGA